MSVEQMVMAAMDMLNSPKGVSIRAIENYIGYQLGIEGKRMRKQIKRFLVKALAEGKLVKAKGIGLAGSFKLPPPAKKERSPKKKAVEVPAEHGSSTSSATESGDYLLAEEASED